MYTGALDCLLKTVRNEVNSEPPHRVQLTKLPELVNICALQGTIILSSSSVEKSHSQIRGLPLLLLDGRLLIPCY